MFCKMNKKNIDIICEAVAEEFGIPPEAIASNSKLQVHTWPRGLAIYIASRRGEMKNDIAEYFRITPSSVRYYVKRVEPILSYNMGDRYRYDRILRRLDICKP